MSKGLREELTTWKARTPHPGGSAPVFLSGRPRGGEVPSDGPQRRGPAQGGDQAANVELAKLGHRADQRVRHPALPAPHVCLDAGSAPRRLGLYRRAARPPRCSLHFQLSALERAAKLQTEREAEALRLDRAISTFLKSGAQYTDLCERQAPRRRRRAQDGIRAT
jgi:hypothetical protein